MLDEKCLGINWQGPKIWNQKLIFGERGKPKNPPKILNTQKKTNKQLFTYNDRSEFPGLRIKTQAQQWEVAH